MSKLDNGDGVAGVQVPSALDFNRVWSRLAEAQKTMEKENTDESGDAFADAERLFLAMPARTDEERKIKAAYVRKEFVEHEDGSAPGGVLLDAMLACYVDELMTPRPSDLVADYKAARWVADNAVEDVAIEKSIPALVQAEIRVLACTIPSVALVRTQREIVDRHLAASTALDCAIRVAILRAFDRSAVA